MFLKFLTLYSFNSRTFPATRPFFPELGVAVGFVNWDLWVYWFGSGNWRIGDVGLGIENCGNSLESG